jgi:hypothetical protein
MPRRRLPSRVVAFGVAGAVLLTACSAFGEDAGHEDAGAADPVARPAEVERAPVALDGLFVDAGISVVESPAVPAGRDPRAVAPLELWSWQVDNLEREHVAGGGYLGAELDELVDLGPAAAGLPFSYLVAAWLADPPTPTAERALGLIGQQSWSQASTVVFPTAVLALFVTDVAALSVELGWPSTDGPVGFRSGLERAHASPLTGICSTLSGWVNAVLDTLFDALTIELDDGSAFGWLADIWNIAVELAGAVITGLVDVLTAPIVGAIADGVAIVGTLAMLASMLQPWTLTMVPSAGAVPFAVGDEPAVAGTFHAWAATNAPDVWPDVLVDCASAVELELPDLSSAAGATVAWDVIGFPELGSEEGRDTVIRDDQTAGLRFVTGREESGVGDEVIGYVAASATVTSSTPSQLQALLSQLLTDAVPIEPFSAAVAELFDALTEPIFLELAELVQVHGAGTMQVIRHEIDARRLFDGRWTGLAFQFSTSTPDTLAAGSTSEGAETRVIVPLEVDVEGGEIVRSSASLAQHTSSFIVGRTVAGADGSGYAVIVAEADRLTVGGDPTAMTIAGDTRERYETFIASDLPSDVETFARSGSYGNTLTVTAVTCASSGEVTAGTASGGRYVTGYWLAHEVADEAAALSSAGIALSARILAATELPARPADRTGLDGAIEAFDRSVERVRDGVPAGCGIEPVLQWAGALRGRADAA